MAVISGEGPEIKIQPLTCQRYLEQESEVEAVILIIKRNEIIYVYNGII